MMCSKFDCESAEQEWGLTSPVASGAPAYFNMMRERVCPTTNQQWTGLRQLQSLLDVVPFLAGIDCNTLAAAKYFKTFAQSIPEQQEPWSC